MAQKLGLVVSLLFVLGAALAIFIGILAPSNAPPVVVGPIQPEVQSPDPTRTEMDGVYKASKAIRAAIEFVPQEDGTPVGLNKTTFRELGTALSAELLAVKDKALADPNASGRLQPHIDRYTKLLNSCIVMDYAWERTTFSPTQMQESWQDILRFAQDADQQLLLASQTSKEEKPKRPAEKQEEELAVRKKGASTSFSTVEVDKKTDRLPPDFKGQDIEDVEYTLLMDDSKRNKSEFETTEQWRERLRRSESQPLFGHLMSDSVFAFRLEDQQCTYDSDQAAFVLDLSIWREPDEACLLSVKTTKVRPVGGQFTHYYLKFQNVDSFPVASRSDSYIRIIVPVPLNQARLVKPALSLLALCRLKRPWVGLKPWESLVGDTTRILNTEIIAVWVYNRDSGFIYKKFSE